MLQLFFGGSRPGSFMVSYNWNDLTQYDTEAPRVLASLLPCSWLDINELIAGVDVTEFCAEAAKNATFRFMFLSESYMASKNCMTEFNTIIQFPARSFAFVYDKQILSTKRAGKEVNLKTELRNLGIPIIVLQKPYKLDSKFIFTELLRNEVGVDQVYPAIKVLLQQRSPLIRSYWAATAAAICGDHPKGLMRFWPAKWFIIFSLVLITIFTWLFSLVQGMSSVTNSCGQSNAGQLVNIQSEMKVSFLFFIIAQFLSIVGFLRMYKSVCYNKVFTGLSDGTLLLLVLHQLKVKLKMTHSTNSCNDLLQLSFIFIPLFIILYFTVSFL